MSLEDYDRLKLRLADILRSAAGSGRMPADGQTSVRGLLGRLAEDRFNIVVVGRFSRGKSSLMNALLGSERLPTGFVPLTSVITSVAYGTEERATLYFDHTTLFEDIPLDALAGHITERGNPGNRRRIRAAEIQLPAEILRRGFYFVDTPGLGSSIVENTRTTEAFLPQADAFVLVSSFDSPLSEEECNLLWRVHRSGRRVFVVLNKMDAVDPAARAEIERYAAERLRGIFEGDAPAIFAVSATAAMAARRAGDQAAYAASGVPALEAALTGFVMRDRQTHFLVNMCRRVEDVLPSDAPSREGLARFRAELAEIPEIHASPAELPREDIASTLPECEICAQVGEQVFAFLATFQARIGRPGPERDALAARGGLCAPHMLQLAKLAAPTEICAGIAPVMDHYATLLRGLATAESPGATLTGHLPSEESCPACRVAAGAMRAAESRICEHVGDDLQHLSAICLPHLGRLLDALAPPVARRVLERQARIFERLGTDMRRYALKKEGARRDMATQEEFSAARRATRILVRNPDAETGAPAQGSRALSQ